MKSRWLKALTPLEAFCILGGLFLTGAYYWIMDDAFVYFRYIDNFLFLRIGLVYNAGEYVEGFTSPLWTLILLPLRAAHLELPVIINLLAALSFVLFALLLVELNRSLSPEGPILNLPLAYLGLNYGVLCYFSSGLETPLVQIAAVAYALCVIRPESKAFQAIVGLSPMMRPEFMMTAILCGLWVQYRTRKLPVCMVMVCLLTLGPYMLFRIYYYADLFPNTFYLKNVSLSRQGLIYLRQTLETYHFYALSILAAALVALIHGKRDSRLVERGVMWMLALSVTIYVVRIGGDPRHYRYLAFPFILATCSFAGLPELAAQAYLRPPSSHWVLLAAGGILALGAHLCYPPQLDSHPFYSRIEPENVRQQDKIADAAGHRANPNLAYEKWGKVVNIERQESYRREHPIFAYQGWLVEYWCCQIYQAYNLRVIHSLGLADAYLARTKMESKRAAHKPGLLPLAADMERIYKRAPKVGIGTFRWSVESGFAPAWVVKNLKTIEDIERKVYNQHHFLENLRLAFMPSGRIIP